MAIPVDRQYRQNAVGLHHRAIAGVTVLHYESWTEPLLLNREFQIVWTCLEVGGSIQQIAADISIVLDDSSARIQEDVAVAFEKLAELDLIEPVESD